MSDHRPMDLQAHPLLGQWDFGQELPSVRTPLSPASVIERLDALARRGKLPGFLRGAADRFSVEVFAEPFDRGLFGDALPDSGGTLIRLRMRMLLKMPLIYAAIVAVTVWPGVWLMDSMLRTYFPAYSAPTWAWYIPLTVLPLPWMARSLIRKSNRLGHESAKEQIARITEAVEGALVTVPPARG